MTPCPHVSTTWFGVGSAVNPTGGSSSSIVTVACTGPGPPSRVWIAGNPGWRSSSSTSVSSASTSSSLTIVTSCVHTAR